MNKHDAMIYSGRHGRPGRPEKGENDVTVKLTFFEGVKPVGSGSVTDGCIHDVEVSAAHQRQGIGTKIINALRSIGGTWLWVDTEDIGVMQFYEKCGFEIEEVVTGERFAVMRIPPDPAEEEPT